MVEISPSMNKIDVNKILGVKLAAAKAASKVPAIVALQIIHVTWCAKDLNLLCEVIKNNGHP
jgi:hypothetical protein